MNKLAWEHDFNDDDLHYDEMPEPCEHEHTVIESRGSMRFVNGDVDDDLTEVVVCTDCLRDLKAAA